MLPLLLLLLLLLQLPLLPLLRLLALLLPPPSHFTDFYHTTTPVVTPAPTPTSTAPLNTASTSHTIGLDTEAPAQPCRALESHIRQRLGCFWGIIQAVKLG